MNLNFAAALAALGANAAVRIANAVRPTADYLFATLLPEVPSPDYSVKSGTMTVRATMAGMVGMDSPYPPAGIVESQSFVESTAKIALEVGLTEATIRTLQAWLAAPRGGGLPSVDVAQEALNFLDKLIIQPMLDTAEYLRGECLVLGAIDWTFNQKRLQVSYGIPAGNMLPNRTGTAHYGGSASVFWSDVRALRKLLRYNVRTFIAHPDTIDLILGNTVNALAVTAQEGSTFSVRRYITIAGQQVPASDARDTITLVGYDKEGEIFDPATPGGTIKIPFMPSGKILAVGNNSDSGYRVGQGSTVDPTGLLALGYTHIGPTTEAGGAPGRWANLYVPEHLPWSLHGRGACNILPVLEAPKKIAIASTDMV